MNVYNDNNSVEENANQGTNPFGEPVLLDDLRKQIRNAVGQPCPPTQTDGGTPGDAGNATTNTAKSLEIIRPIRSQVAPTLPMLKIGMNSQWIKITISRSPCPIIKTTTT